jgi:DNA repair protein RecN (Recombination protein N)
MLVNLHVKNLALIDEVEVDFGEGLNILTGETGAGKSIIIGSISLALGGKMSRDMIRENAPFALVELVFSVNSPKLLEELKKQDIFAEDGQIIITRKITGNRSISKINGEACTVSQIREVAGKLLDIHGQHEHQSLLYPAKQLEILDEYGKDQLTGSRGEVKAAYLRYKKLQEELAGYQMDEEQRKREISFLEFEIREITEAALKEGEDEELELKYRKLLNGKKILENASLAYGMCGLDSGCSELIGRSLHLLNQIAEYDESLDNLCAALSDVEDMLNGFNRELSGYLDRFSYSEEEFHEMEERLDLINHLKMKFGQSIGQILQVLSEKEKQLARLLDFETEKARLMEEYNIEEKKLARACQKLSDKRKTEALKLESNISESLMDLNFADVRFKIDFSEKEHFTPEGTDAIQFLIATNPGEALKPLAKVVSGGELSRIMLAIKTLLADKDDTQTLIFDEIDTGISGRTAQKVSEKMAVIGRNHQVLCITHLPQIAAMADSHYLIEKKVSNMETTTRIRKMVEEESVREIARILGGAKITSTVLDSAREMKHVAQEQKNSRVK